MSCAGSKGGARKITTDMWPWFHIVKTRSGSLSSAKKIIRSKDTTVASKESDRPAFNDWLSPVSSPIRFPLGPAVCFQSNNKVDFDIVIKTIRANICLFAISKPFVNTTPSQANRNAFPPVSFAAATRRCYEKGTRIYLQRRSFLQLCFTNSQLPVVMDDLVTY